MQYELIKLLALNKFLMEAVSFLYLDFFCVEASNYFFCLSVDCV